MSIMRKLSVLTFAMAMVILSGCSTPVALNQNEKIDAEIQATLKDFQKSYNTMDVNMISNHFNNPTTLIGPGGVNISVDKEKFNNAFVPVVGYLEEKDYSRSEWRNVDVKVLDKDLAIASADVIQYDVNNDIIESFGVTFSMSHNGNSWKISTVTTHPSSDQNDK